MVIIFEHGDEFWIEHLNIDISLGDPAGRYVSSAAALERSGVYVGSAIITQLLTNNDNTQAMGGMPEVRAGGAPAAYGTFTDTIIIRQTKQIGTAGATIVNYQALIFLKKGR